MWLEAMVAWSWSELAVNSIKDSPKKESEILIKMFHIYLIVHCFLIKRKWMENIVFQNQPILLFPPLKKAPPLPHFPPHKVGKQPTYSVLGTATL